MEIRCGNERINVSCNDGRITVFMNGETYSKPGDVDVPDKTVTVKELFPDKDLLDPGQWSRYGFFIGPFYFGVFCGKDMSLSFEIRTTTTIFETEVEGVFAHG